MLEKYSFYYLSLKVVGSFERDCDEITPLNQVGVAWNESAIWKNLVE